MKLSVILPVYNAELYIIQTLNCLTRQSLKDLEIIILQDACTDNTDRLVIDYIAAHPDCSIKNIRFQTNQGPSHGRNVGAEMALGDYIHFMDADDLIDTDFYQKLYNAALETGADVACAGFLNERYPTQNWTYPHKLVITNAQDRIDQTRVDKYGYAWRYLIRRCFWRDLNFSFPNGLRYCEDIAMIPHVVLSANHLILVPDTFYVYKYRPNSLTTDQSPETQIAREQNRHQALQARDQIYRDNHVAPSQTQTDIFGYKLFGFIPIGHSEYRHEHRVKKIYFCGVPILKRQYK